MKVNPVPQRTRVTDRISITPRGKKKIYTAEFWYGNQHRRKSLHTSNKKEAEARARKLDVQLAGGEYGRVPDHYDVPQAIAEFIAAKQAEGSKPMTIVKYRYELGKFAAFLAEHHVTSLSRITAPLHDRYRKERREELTVYTVYTHAIIHKHFLSWCVSRELLAKSPLEKVMLKKPARIPRTAATFEQLNAVLGEAPSSLAAQLATLAFTGMRAGELQYLRRQDVDLPNGWIHICNRAEWTTKQGASRTIPIHPRLHAYLAAQPHGGAYLFSRGSSRRAPHVERQIDIRNLNEQFQRVAERLGMTAGQENQGLVLHSLRHFFETFTVNAGIPQPLVDKWMGHTGNKTMSAVYYHLDDQASQRLMATVPFGPALTLQDQNHGAA